MGAEVEIVEDDVSAVARLAGLELEVLELVVLELVVLELVVLELVVLELVVLVLLVLGNAAGTVVVDAGAPCAGIATSNSATVTSTDALSDNTMADLRSGVTSPPPSPCK